MSLDEKTKNVSKDFYRQDYDGLKTLIYTSLIFASVMVGFKMYDLKYGKTAQENFTRDSLIEVQHKQDSIKRIKQYQELEHLKLQPYIMKE